MLRSILFTLALTPFAATAVEKDLTNVVETAGGVYSRIYIHELGHALAYKAFGVTDIVIEVPRSDSLLSGRTTVPFSAPLSSGQQRVVSVTGLLAANVAGELVLQRRGLQGSPYAQAVLGTAVVSNFMHVYTYYTRSRGRDGYGGNDIDQFEMAGGNPHGFSAVLLSYSAWALHRMRKDGVPLFFVNL